MNNLHRINRPVGVPTSIVNFVSDWPESKYLWLPNEELLRNLTTGKLCVMKNILFYEKGYTTNIPPNLRIG